MRLFNCSTTTDLLIWSLAVALVIYYLVTKVNLYRSLPPGPWGLPFLGLLIQLNTRNCLKEFANYAEKYGSIFSLSLGNHTVVVVSDHKLIQETLKNDTLNGRPNFEVWIKGNGGKRNRGILFCDANTTWYEQRRFALRNLRDFGFGKGSMEGLLLHELEELVKFLKKDLGKVVSLRNIFNASVLNSLWIILAGHRFELDDKEFLEIINMVSTTLQRGSIVSPGLFYTLPFKLLLKRELWKYGLQARQKVLDLMKKEVREHRDSYQESITRDFIDVYFQQQKIAGEKSGSVISDTQESNMNLVVTLKDLFLAGAETTSTTLLWAILYLCKSPHVQRKLQAEIDTVIGRNRLPQREDKPKLIYLEAVLNEVHRHCSLVPVSVYHRALKDSKLGGYFIPKDTIIFANLFQCHHSKAYWGDPFTFRPERFLDERGTRLIKNDALMPFSHGKRQCLGEILARETLFIFLSGLIQEFTFELSQESEAKGESLLEHPPTFIIAPQDYTVILKSRS